MKQLVIVESPTKAKTLSKFLSSDYRVVSTMGHLRDLPNSNAEVPKDIKGKEWAGMGIDYTDGFKPYYVVSKNKKVYFEKLKEQLKNVKTLILATDNDREGESISWHLLEMLSPKIPVKRIVFRQISKKAILDALENYRQLDKNLVSAQETRRILDRLVGYTISPLLWKKIAYRLSAGRVQSVAMNLVVEREIERMKFVSSNYWGLNALLSKGGVDFESHLIKVEEKAVAVGKDFDEKTGKLKQDRYLLDEKKAKNLIAEIKNADWLVKEIVAKKQEQKTAAPFITSTLQQEASNRLRFSAKKTMQVAQSLYEKGYITYMRTDSFSLTASTIENIRSIVKRNFGDDYLPAKPYLYKSKSKSAQEAHEAIHPVNLSLEAKDLKESGDEKTLYLLIWRKTIASQMSPIQKEFLHVDVEVKNCLFRSTGKKIVHPGYSAVYQKDEDQQELPILSVSEKIPCKKIDATEHNTLPPSRYSEASLIKFLEKKDIGRPSTYANIISTIIDREYVRKSSDALVPTFIAFAVSDLLKENFPELIDVSFTAKMEATLDEIASGKKEKLNYLEEFYNGKEGLLQSTQEKTKSIQSTKYKTIKLPKIPEIKISSYGPYIEKEKKNVDIPTDIAPSELTPEYIQKLMENKHQDNAIGKDPKTGKSIYLLRGRYGPYLQLGLAEDKEEKPKRVSITNLLEKKGVDLEIALTLFSLPIDLGEHPEGGKVFINTGRYGPYVVLEKTDGKKDFRSITMEQIDSLDLNSAVEILGKEKSYTKNQLVRKIGEHKGKALELYLGRYGVYLKYDAKNFAVPKDKNTETLTLKEAVTIISKTKKK
jgi:DNA topoisomerase-1